MMNTAKRSDSVSEWAAEPAAGTITCPTGRPINNRPQVANLPYIFGVDVRQQGLYDVGSRHYESLARDARFTHSEDAAGRGDARLDHLGENPADLSGCAAGQPGLSVSSLTSPGPAGG